MKKQTSVDWLAEQLHKYYNDELNEMGEDHITHGMKHLLKHMDKKLQTARQMHREEVEEAYEAGFSACDFYGFSPEYYNQTFETP